MRISIGPASMRFVRAGVLIVGVLGGVKVLFFLVGYFRPISSKIEIVNQTEHDLEKVELYFLDEHESKEKRGKVNFPPISSKGRLTREAINKFPHRRMLALKAGGNKIHLTAPRRGQDYSIAVLPDHKFSISTTYLFDGKEISVRTTDY